MQVTAGSCLRLQRGHTMKIKEKHYEKIVEDVEQMHESSHYLLIFSYPFKKSKLYTPHLKVCTYHLILNSNSVFNVIYTMCNYQNQQSDFYNDMLQMFQLFDQNNTSYFFLFGFSVRISKEIYLCIQTKMNMETHC